MPVETLLTYDNYHGKDVRLRCERLKNIRVIGQLQVIRTDVVLASRQLL